MNALLNITVDLDLVLGLQVLAIGMLAIFSVLVIILIGLIFFKFIFNKKNSPIDTANSNESTTVVNSAALNQNDEIVAAICAAIAMAESENGNAKFRVVSFKRM